MVLMHHAGLPSHAAFLEGHFPGNPIVPGAVLLAFSVRALADHGLGLDRIKRVKFLRQLRPDQPFDIRLEQGERVSKLIWRSGGETLAEAQVVLERCHG